jgi:flagellar basal body-associated protein FliL
MTSPVNILLLVFVVALVAVFTWLLRREAKARSKQKGRAEIVANIRAQTERESEIIGWMVRDDPAQAKSAHEVRDTH